MSIGENGDKIKVADFGIEPDTLVLGDRTTRLQLYSSEQFEVNMLDSDKYGLINLWKKFYILKLIDFVFNEIGAGVKYFNIKME